MLSTIERLTHLMATYLERELSALGVTQAEAHVLAQLARGGDVPIGTLHREFARKRSTLTNVLDRLEARGFVRRELNPADRRSFVIHLTPAGRRAARQVTRAVDRLEADVRRAVSESELAGFEAVAVALESAADPDDGGPLPS